MLHTSASPLFVCIAVNWTHWQQAERPEFQGVSWKPPIKLTVLFLGFFFLIKKIAIFALKLQINFKRTFECYTVKRPVPRSWDREEQMVCYLCLGTRSSQIPLETSSAAFKGDLKFLNVIQYLWYFLKNQCQWALCSFCTGSDLICTLQLSYQHMFAVVRENAFQHHHLQSLSNATSNLQHHINTFTWHVY